MPRISFGQTLLIFLACLSLIGHGAAQDARPTFSLAEDDQAPPALIRSVRVVPGQQGPAVEIITTRPMVPVITLLTGPARLVVDMPRSYLIEKQKVDFRDDQISRVRINQFQKKPPVVRLVVDLAKACGYDWDEAGNRLMIRLRPQEPAAEKPAPTPPAPSFTRGVAPAQVEGAVSGTMLPATLGVTASSSVTARRSTAVVKLARGGEVRVCPGTTVSVTPSQTGRELMLGISTGALEAHYALGAAADSVLTPDFRILLPGPGELHYAISADSRGNTCVRALPGNTASAVVSELMGNGVYQLKPSEQVVFRAGQVALLDAKIPADCGCPAPTVPVTRAAASETPSGARAEPAAAAARSAVPATPAALETGSETARLPPSRAQDVHVQVEAPLVFRAADSPAPAAPGTGPASASAPTPTKTAQIAALPAPSRADATEAAAKPPRHGFLGRIKGALATLFR